MWDFDFDSNTNDPNAIRVFTHLRIRRRSWKWHYSASRLFANASQLRDIQSIDKVIKNVAYKLWEYWMFIVFDTKDRDHRTSYTGVASAKIQNVVNGFYRNCHTFVSIILTAVSHRRRNTYISMLVLHLLSSSSESFFECKFFYISFEVLFHCGMLTYKCCQIYRCLQCFQYDKKCVRNWINNLNL